jgi:hypothetical protein
MSPFKPSAAWSDLTPLWVFRQTAFVALALDYSPPINGSCYCSFMYVIPIARAVLAHSLIRMRLWPALVQIPSHLSFVRRVAICSRTPRGSCRISFVSLAFYPQVDRDSLVASDNDRNDPALYDILNECKQTSICIICNVQLLCFLLGQLT